MEWEKIFANYVTNKDLSFQNIQTAHTTQQEKNNPINTHSKKVWKTTYQNILTLFVCLFVFPD